MTWVGHVANQVLNKASFQVVSGEVIGHCWRGLLWYQLGLAKKSYEDGSCDQDKERERSEKLTVNYSPVQRTRTSNCRGIRVIRSLDCLCHCHALPMPVLGCCDGVTHSDIIAVREPPPSAPPGRPIGGRNEWLPACRESPLLDARIGITDDMGKLINKAAHVPLACCLDLAGCGGLGRVHNSI